MSTSSSLFLLEVDNVLEQLFRLSIKRLRDSIITVSLRHVDTSASTMHLHVVSYRLLHRKQVAASAFPSAAGSVAFLPATESPIP